VGLLDALDIDRAHVIGHDWGGFTGFLLGLEHPSRIDRLLLCNTPEPWARLNPRVAIGLRRAWYVPLVAAPVLGEQMVRRRGFVQWFLRLGGQAALFPDADASLYADQFRDSARAAAASRLYRYYLQLVAQGILPRRPLAGSGSALQPGCCSAQTTSTFLWHCWRRSRLTAMTSPSTSSRAAATGCRRSAPTSLPSRPGPSSADDARYASTAPPTFPVIWAI
jgi:pimeloyl-ACP methyl ester carboxylesterase